MKYEIMLSHHCGWPLIYYNRVTIVIFLASDKICHIFLFYFSCTLIKTIDTHINHKLFSEPHMLGGPPPIKRNSLHSYFFRAFNSKRKWSILTKKLVPFGKQNYGIYLKVVINAGFPVDIHIPTYWCPMYPKYPIIL